MLQSSDGRPFYLNRSLEPAFFAPKEIQHDIDDLTAKFGEKPVLLFMPKRTGLGSGIIAKWGGLTLHPLTKEQSAPLAEGQSPKVGLLVDFLNDFVTSVKSDLPVYRLDGSAGYVYNATVTGGGRGKLRFFAADPSALSRTSVDHSVEASTEEPQNNPKDSAPRNDASSGSGFFVSTKGDVLTNAHVIDGCRRITVSQYGQPPFEARLIAKDGSNDLALIRIDTQPSSVPPLRRSIRLGEQIAVYGFPLSGVLASSGNFTLGNVTAIAGLQDDSRILQISSPVQPGNSGAPLLDEAGNVVGIVVGKLNTLRFAEITKDVPQNINFAIKAAVVQTFLEINGITNTSSPGSSHLAPDEIAEKAKSFSVYVECNAPH